MIPLSANFITRHVRPAPKPNLHQSSHRDGRPCIRVVTLQRQGPCSALRPARQCHTLITTRQLKQVREPSAHARQRELLSMSASHSYLSVDGRAARRTGGENAAMERTAFDSGSNPSIASQAGHHSANARLRAILVELSRVHVSPEITAPHAVVLVPNSKSGDRGACNPSSPARRMDGSPNVQRGKDTLICLPLTVRKILPLAYLNDPHRDPQIYDVRMLTTLLSCQRHGPRSLGLL